MYFNLDKKIKFISKSKTNPFIDPIGYKKFVAEKERDFYQALVTEEAMTANPSSK